ncbi:hypothetical protein PsYK624_165270 [Phanerochaete sordida]|uniref:Uncharacterized protein n=1 Tax=Phanerochaete sordida TaxID=48140 RepID=A0A9P3GTC0_9APHY|nr:hypothetical protein PsYK624_165270 [Phanerochaete sordida]
MGGDDAMMHGSEAAIVDAYATRAGAEQRFSTTSIDVGTGTAIACGDSWIPDTFAGAAVCRARAHGCGVEPDGASVLALAQCVCETWGLYKQGRIDGPKSCSAAISLTLPFRFPATRSWTLLSYHEHRLQRTQAARQVRVLRPPDEGAHRCACLLATSRLQLLTAYTACVPVRSFTVHRAGAQHVLQRGTLSPQGPACQSRAQMFPQASSYTAEAQIM